MLEPTFTGCGVRARPVAVMWLLDGGEREPGDRPRQCRQARLLSQQLSRLPEPEDWVIGRNSE